MSFNYFDRLVWIWRAQNIVSKIFQDGNGKVQKSHLVFDQQDGLFSSYDFFPFIGMRFFFNCFDMARDIDFYLCSSAKLA